MIRPFVYGAMIVFSISSGFAEENNKVTCNEALLRLVEGNQRYVEGRLLHPNRGQESRLKTAPGQQPFAIILGCSDSRVSPEIVFDQGIGDLFIVRVAGNVLGPIELDSIEFAALYLGCSIVLVLGHEDCGAIKAVLEGKTKDIETIATLIEPSIAEAKKGPKPILKNAILDNVKHVMQELKTSASVSQLIDDKKIAVMGGYYDFHTGKVNIF